METHMHPDELRRLGALLFGGEWQRAMARLDDLLAASREIDR